MKFKSFQTVSFLILYVFALSSCITINNNKKTAIEENYIRISKEYPRYFEQNDGKTWIPVMINFIMPNGDETAVFNTVESYFKKFSENGGNAVRIWISSPFLEIEDQEEGHYDPVKFHRINRLLEIAKKYRLKIKFTLQHIRSISPESTQKNSWSNSTVLSADNGGSFHDIKEFVTTSKGKKVYLDRVKAIAERYRDNNQIFSWELWNEMDAVDENEWYPFTAELLDSVKSLFPNHLVVQTLGSMHSKDAEERYEKLFKLNRNEYITLHRYLDPGTAWNQYDLVKNPIDKIAGNAVQFAYRDSLIKPILMNEIGAVEANHSGPSKLYDTDSLGVLLHDMVFTPFFCGAAGCGSVWHWDVYVNKQYLWYQYQRFNNAIKGLDPIKEKFHPFYLQKDSVRMYGLRGLKNTVIWCRDTRNNWKTEIEDGKKPEIKKSFLLETDEISKSDFVEAKVYNPWQDKWTVLPLKNNRIEMPPFLRSTILFLRNN
ncbi:MAG TPA: hypothetical protein VF346_10840 [Bacteroidales bacterium]